MSQKSSEFERRVAENERLKSAEKTTQPSKSTRENSIEWEDLDSICRTVKLCASWA